ncbi:MAG: hypothetical protein MUE30_01860 [Spirosomaceae bacterium]|jgi:hypothetical protein|nr:hypothetical protein [Spirosomataceae bacterium]
MKKFFLLLGMTALTMHCTRQTNESAKPTAIPVKLVTHKDAIDSLRKDTNAVLKPLKISTLTNEQQAIFWNNHDLSYLFFSPEPESSYFNRLDGFYGDDRYRIELYFAQVTRDSLQPNVYHFKGKNRFKKNITDFEGTVTLTKLSTFQDPNLNEEHYGHDEFELKEAYTAEATFELKENEATKGSGVFSGKMFIDFFERKDGQVELWYFSPNSLAQASGFKFEGTWQNYRKTLTKPVVWAKDLFAFSNNILTDFSIGERDVEINKKYRHLGWDSYWENDEWWQEAATIQ